MGPFVDHGCAKDQRLRPFFLFSKFTHRLTKAGDVHEKTAIGSGQNFWYFFGQWSWRQVTMRRWHGISRSSRCWKVLHHTYPDDIFSALDAENSLLKPSKHRRNYCQTCLPCTLLNGLMAHESKDLWRVEGSSCNSKRLPRTSWGGGNWQWVQFRLQPIHGGWFLKLNAIENHFACVWYHIVFLSGAAFELAKCWDWHFNRDWECG